MKCWCSLCKKDFEFEVSDSEIQSLVKISKNPFNHSGRLILACDECFPMKYSEKKEEKK